MLTYVLLAIMVAALYVIISLFVDRKGKIQELKGLNELLKRSDDTINELNRQIAEWGARAIKNATTIEELEASKVYHGVNYVCIKWVKGAGSLGEEEVIIPITQENIDILRASSGYEGNIQVRTGAELNEGGDGLKFDGKIACTLSPPLKCGS